MKRISKIMYCDDDKDDQRTFSEELHSFYPGVSYFPASSPEELLRSLHISYKALPDLIFLKISQPGTAGINQVHGKGLRDVSKPVG